MRLIHRDQADIRARECVQHALCHQPFGRQIQKSRLPCRHATPGGDILIAVYPGINGVGRHPRQAQGRHLVLHQRHQRRDHDGQAAQHQRRHLVAERFSRAGRHHRQHMAAGQQCVHRRRLAGAKIVKTENILQDAPLGVVGQMRDMLIHAAL